MSFRRVEELVGPLPVVSTLPTPTGR